MFEFAVFDSLGRSQLFYTVAWGLKSLKTNKSAGIDLIMNEHIKSTWHLMARARLRKIIQYYIG